MPRHQFRKLFIYAVRSSQTPPLQEGELDIAQRLSPHGEIQAGQMGTYLAHVNFDLILASPVKSVDQTLHIIYDENRFRRQIPRITVPELYPRPEAPLGQKYTALYEMFRNRPLWKYQEHPDYDALIQGYVEPAEDAIEDAIRENIGNKKEIAVLLGGHSVFTPAIFANQCGIGTLGEEWCQSNLLREAQVMLLTIERTRRRWNTWMNLTTM